MVVCGRVLAHVAGCGVMWQGWRHVTRVKGIWQGHMSKSQRCSL